MCYNNRQGKVAFAKNAAHVELWHVYANIWKKWRRRKEMEAM